jgi:hypothetical protein
MNVVDMFNIYLIHLSLRLIVLSKVGRNMYLVSDP